MYLSDVEILTTSDDGLQVRRFRVPLGMQPQIGADLRIGVNNPLEYASVSAIYPKL
jgi:hypothetical protein